MADLLTLAKITKLGLIKSDPGRLVQAIALHDSDPQDFFAMSISKRPYVWQYILKNGKKRHNSGDRLNRMNTA